MRHHVLADSGRGLSGRSKRSADPEPLSRSPGTPRSSRTRGRPRAAGPCHCRAGFSHCCGSTSTTPTRAGRRDWIFATRSAGRTGARCSAPRSASCAHAGRGLLGYVEQDGKSSAGVGRHGRRCRLRDAPVRSRGGEPCRQAPGGGLRFHDLYHSYGTWLVDDGVPVNTLQRVMRLRALDDDEDPGTMARQCRLVPG